LAIEPGVDLGLGAHEGAALDHRALCLRSAELRGLLRCADLKFDDTTDLGLPLPQRPAIEAFGELLIVADVWGSSRP